MENAVDALKMAGAAMLFVLAFTISMVMFSKARETTDAVLDNLQLKNFFTKVDALDTNVTRKVGIETIIPTLYRYCQSDDNIRIRIVTEVGGVETELQVFDQEIESLVNSGLEVTPTSTNYAYYTALADKYNNQAKEAYMFGAPWANQGKQYYLERINAYIYGTKAKHMTNLDYSEHTGTKNYLMRYKDRTFEESYLEYRTGGHVQIDEYGEEIVTIPASTKIIVTYKLLPE